MRASLGLACLLAPVRGLVLPPRVWRPAPARRSAAPPRCAQGGSDAAQAAKEKRVRELQVELAKLQREEAELEAWDDVDEELEMDEDLFDDFDQSKLADMGLDPTDAPTAAPSPPASAPVSAKGRVAGLPIPSPDCELPPGSVVCIAGCGTPVGRAMLQSLAAGVPDRGWSLRALDRAADVPGVEPVSASPPHKALAGASALIILSEGAVGKGGVPTKKVGDLLDALPPTGLRRLVYVSVHGAERTSELPFSLQNAFGGKLDRAREAEGEVRLRAEGRIPAVSVVRFGGVKEAAGAGKEAGGVGGGAGGAEEVCELAPGDALQGEVSASAAGGLLVQTLTRMETVNATFSAGPKAASAEGWEDELIKLVGPEIFRRKLGSGLSSGEPLVDWVRTWARERGAVGLTSKVELEDVHEGVILRFVKGAGAFDSNFDKVETKEDKWASASKKAAAKTDGALKIVAEAAPYGRVRVMRAEIEEGAKPKEMSEAALLEKLGRDLDRLEAKRKGKGA